MKKRRWLLPFVLMMILVPTLSALIFSWVGLYQQQHAMGEMAQRYAQSLARDIVREESGNTDETPLRRHRRMGLFLKMLTVGPPVPGWIATVGPGGIKMQGSPGSRITVDMVPAVNKALATGELQTMTLETNDKRPPAAVAVCPFPSRLRAIIVVISHYMVPGSMMRLITLQPVMSISVSFIALVGIFLLWRWCVIPLRRTAETVESVDWGHDQFNAGAPGPLPELREMHRALSDLSIRAIDRETLKKNYVGDIVRTQEEERTRLAREIHDSPLQTVASLIQRIQLALRGLAKTEIDKDRVRDHLTVANDAALTAVQEMRDVCDRLSPPWLTLGAARSLEEIANRLSRIHNVAVAASVAGNADDLAEKDVLALCRIIQEAVANSARHGHATSVDVKLDCTSEPRQLQILDNGCGIDRKFDPEVLRVQGHRGIASMSERAALMGGSFSITPGENGGTLITVSLPPREAPETNPSTDGQEA